MPVPFDPDAVWAPKAVHRVAGTLNGVAVRAVITEHDGERGFLLGPAWVRCGVEPGVRVTVVLAPEGPQRGDLAEDVAAALEASPAAGAFFDSLAQFYRRGYLRWIDGTKGRPETRARRITEMVGLLEAGKKQRPRT
ncbi:YdeI/OmpD-associated family protein [Sphaerisporangium aureirubrum]|uniref:YdeI/OmpD-associated family protein n=1 Tax=Sphaerisporangium aureirubrum TaxID=1544736 RepID=A0ABW1NL84_9ACTN